MAHNNATYDADMALGWVRDNVCAAAEIASTAGEVLVEDAEDFKTYLDGYIAGTALVCAMFGNDEPASVAQIVGTMIATYIGSDYE